MLWTKYKGGFGKLFSPIVTPIAKSGISPNALTLGCLVLCAIACAWFIHTKSVLTFCIAITIIGCLDGLDGMVARASGRTSKFGAYLDAICDRYFDIMVLISVAYVTGYWILSVVALSGSLLVSYSKARAAIEVPVSNHEWPDLMERGERNFTFIIGLAASSFISWMPLGKDIFWWTLLLLCILVHATAVQRVFRARRFIKDRAD